MEIGLDKLIEITPGVRGGKACLAGHRITVSDVVIWHFKQAMSLEQIAGHYNLALAKVYAAMAYYFEHREEIDRKIDEDMKFSEEMRRNAPSLLQEKLKALNRG